MAAAGRPVTGRSVSTGLRRTGAIIALAAVVAFIWIGTFPTKAECIASGRVVDPSGRHCLAGDGYEQLQEYIRFHANEVIAGVGLLIAGLYLGRRLHLRWRSTGAAPTV